MIGFFTEEELAPEQEYFKGRRPGCAACGLHLTCQSPKMKLTGAGKQGILALAEAPGGEEDEEGMQLIGKAGKRLRKGLRRLGMDLDRDFWKLNAVNCRPPDNRTPTDFEIASCRTRVWNAIKKKKPKIILLLGNTAIKSFLAHRWKADEELGGIMKWRGWAIPDRETGAWVIPVFHPSYVERLYHSRPVVETIFNDDLKLVKKFLKKPFPDWTDEKKYVEVLYDTDRIIKRLKRINANPDKYHTIAIDYETTGLKPHADGHEIVCMGIATGPKKAFAFPMRPEIVPYVKHILKNRKIKKMAHNAKFEEAWSRVILKTEIKGWKWCSMQAAHVIRNTPRISGLKFQTYVNFGVLDYSSHIAPFLKSKGKDGNGFNRVHEAPFDDLMIYCGLDCIYEFRLALKQQKIIATDGLIDKGYALMHDGFQTMGEMEYNGVMLNVPYLEEQSRRVKKRREHLKEQLYTDPTVIKWKKKYGDKFNIGSGKQLADILYHDMKLKPPTITEKGNPSTDKDALDKLKGKAPFLIPYLNLKKWDKADTTYISGLLREQVRSLLHTFFNLHTVVTYRSSSDKPNFQNIPKRNKILKRIIRSGIMARPGRQLLFVDYSGIEVRISACYHKDPNMLKYINDPSTDMHRDTAMDLYILSKDEVSADSRDASKNRFVFPEFYGDYYIGCAGNLWNAIDELNLKVQGSDTPMREHLRKHGIKTYDDFEDHVQDVENKFWHKRFKVYTQWKEDIWYDYQSKGYIEMLTGFRCYEVMKRNEALNRAIQGSAFHCLLWSLNKLRKIAKAEGWKTLSVGQIHDEGIWDVVPEELDHVYKTIIQVMEHDIRKYWDWLIVPLEVEPEITPINGNWYQKEELVWDGR